jgi:hypothetical protein
MNSDPFRDRQKRATSSEKAVYSDCRGAVNRDYGMKPPLLGDQRKRSYKYFASLPALFFQSHSAFSLFLPAADGRMMKRVISCRLPNFFLVPTAVRIVEPRKPVWPVGLPRRSVQSIACTIRYEGE